MIFLTLNLDLYQLFLSRLNWPLFRPAVGLNTEHSKHLLIAIPNENCLTHLVKLSAYKGLMPYGFNNSLDTHRHSAIFCRLIIETNRIRKSIVKIFTSPTAAGQNFETIQLILN